MLLPGLDGPRAPVRLRPYQARAIETLRAHVERGVRRVLLVAPTGAGKTVVAASIMEAAAARGEHVLFLAHRRELIQQTYRKLLELGVCEDDVGVIMASDRRRRPAALVQVASVDTLRARAKPRADLVFVDEAHRAEARTYKAIAAAYPDAVHVGLTATPYRADGKGLGGSYDELVVVASTRELIADGYLVEPRVLTVPASSLPDLSRVRVRGGDYDEKALGDAVNQRALVGNIVEHWLQHAACARTVVFAVSIAHSRHVVERFREAGVPAEHLDGGTPTGDRDALLARLERGETRVVGSVGTLCEGWDMPSVKCAILARPTKSTGLYLQQAGRILRPWEGIGALILDHAGCAVEHGLPQDDRVFTLDGVEKAADPKRKQPRAKTCPSCFAVLPLGTGVCPLCATFLGGATAPLRETADTLVEATHALLPLPRAPPPDDRGVLDVLRRAARTGGRLGWDAFDVTQASPATR
ncbi:MAG: DEAD/DEAH box helicase [Polyangiaceae bacterium]|nr:DEAD/DEAH box helicase [Polyangiaceae bacterium]